MKEALYWVSLDEGRVQCVLCPHRCVIREDKTGICGVRKNVGGVLYSLVWARSIAASVDPIEKKPLFHFLPGSSAFSIATVGCNFRCKFCQNSDISQYPIQTGRITGEELLPQDVVEAALMRGCESISYTYTEPTIYMEYVLDTARLAHEEGIQNTMITNGYISTDVVTKSLKGLIDAANIDLKSFSDSFYKKLCGGRLQGVLDAIRAYYDAGVWIELTTLLIPGENDSEDEIRDIAGFIKSISPDIPWHISRYYPHYLYDKAPPTTVREVEAARDIGLSQGLNYVYTGNVMGHIGENTFCHHCGRGIIKRRGFFVTEKAMRGNTCLHCNQTIPGRFE
ncbi:MAG TPA: AmmeMemoRadiSam system radical SAM enzyme [Deltaproteobacteria bacterium]|nr:AmmeMemoRadiSam system radical SAM enzyme [Deltaproteobacteria bacterium]